MRRRTILVNGVPNNYRVEVHESNMMTMSGLCGVCRHAQHDEII